MTPVTLFARLACSVVVIAISGCSGEPTPEYYGIFAVQAGKLVELPKGGGKFDLELDPTTKFLVYDKAVAELINSAKLVPLLYVRQKIIQDMMGKVARVDEEKTWTGDRSRASELRVQPAKNNPEMAFLVPKEPLKPGVYLLTFDASLQRKAIETGAFFVGKQEVLQNLSSDTYCRDQTVRFGPLGLVEMSDQLFPCSQRDAALTKEQDKQKAAVGNGSRVSNYENTLYGAIDMDNMVQARALIARGLSQEELIEGLNLAAMRGKTELIDLILTKGINVNAVDKNGSTALHQTAINREIAVADMLLQRGADINAKDAYGDTLLMKAAYSGDRKMVEMLLSKGADPNIANTLGKTALSLATEGGQPQAIVSLLLSRGAKPSATDKMPALTASISEGINMASKANMAVALYFEAHRKFPNSSAEAGLRQEVPSNTSAVDSISITKNGVVVVKYRPRIGGGGTVTMTPIKTSEVTMVWQCKGTYASDIMPERCR